MWAHYRPTFRSRLPAQVRLLGSVAQRKTSTPTGGLSFQFADHTRVLLDSPLPVAEFIRQLRAELPEGWEEFVHRSPCTQAFCLLPSRIP